MLYQNCTKDISEISTFKEIFQVYIMYIVQLLDGRGEWRGQYCDTDIVMVDWCAPENLK